MKKVMFVLLAMALTIGSMIAQQPQERKMGDQGKGIKMRIDQLKTDLKLNDEQTQKLEKLFTTQEQEIKTLRQNAEEDRNATREKMQQLRKDRVSAMKEILTPEQLQKFNEKQKEMRRGAGEFRKDGSPKSDSTSVKDHMKKMRRDKNVAPVE